MPWKDGYTISGEKSLTDDEKRRPDGKLLLFQRHGRSERCNRPGGDYRGGSGQSEGAVRLAKEGRSASWKSLGRFGLKATFGDAGMVMARVQARELRELTQAGP